MSNKHDWRLILSRLGVAAGELDWLAEAKLHDPVVATTVTGIERGVPAVAMLAAGFKAASVDRQRLVSDLIEAHSLAPRPLKIPTGKGV